MERTIHRNDFELILMVKMETRHPAEGSFGSEFLAIYNHCVVMAAWSRKTLKFCQKFVRFFGKTTPNGKIFKILFRTFSSRHRSTLLCSNFVKFGPQEISEIVCYLLDKKIACLSKCHYCTDRPQNLRGPAPTIYSECSRFHPNWFTFGKAIAERMNTSKSPHKVNPIFGRYIA